MGSFDRAHGRAIVEERDGRPGWRRLAIDQNAAMAPAQAGAPRTRYAPSGGLHIAYQTLGDGPRTVVFVTPTTFCSEVMWEYGPPAHVLRRFASLGRLVVFDRRGSGQSDPVERPATLEEQVADVLAVMAWRSPTAASTSSRACPTAGASMRCRRAERPCG